MDDEFGASPLGRSKQTRDASVSSHAVKGTPTVLRFDTGREHVELEEVLYGDLLGDETPSTSASSHVATMLKRKVSKLERALMASEETVKVLREEVTRVRAANEELEEKNGVLEHNISSLFNTAKMEIERKDTEIQRLRRACDGRGHGQAQGTRGHGDVGRRSSSAGAGRRETGGSQRDHRQQRHHA